MAGTDLVKVGGSGDLAHRHTDKHALEFQQLFGHLNFRLLAVFEFCLQFRRVYISCIICAWFSSRSLLHAIRLFINPRAAHQSVFACFRTTRSINQRNTCLVAK